MDNYMTIIEDFVNGVDMLTIPVGQYCITDRITAFVIEGSLNPSFKTELESHRNNIDVHLPITTDECYGLREVSDCYHPKSDYDESSDLIIYEDEIETVIKVPQGEFIIFDTNMAHAPMIGDGWLKKCVFKIQLKK